MALLCPEPELLSPVYQEHKGMPRTLSELKATLRNLMYRSNLEFPPDLPLH